MISTIQNRVDDEILPTKFTTPVPVELQKLLKQMVDAGCTHVFMEVSSHAIHQYRIEGIRFAVALFTNITHDHLDYHQSFDEYIQVKKMFFDGLDKGAFAIVNVDDKRGLVMLQNTRAHKKTLSLRTMADYRAKVLENNLSGLILHLDNREVHFKLIGEFNAYNLLSVFAVTDCLGLDATKVLTQMSVLTGAEGRFDYFISKKENIMGIIDYAHTPDALINVLATINKLRKGNEALHTVVGCGGDRDKAKRPLMGMVACEHSDQVIFTSDNPRSEKPDEIIKEMENGVPVHLRKKYISITNRKDALKAVCSQAHPGDIILVAGKGHEKYQEINGERMPFDDRKILNEMFELMDK